MNEKLRGLVVGICTLAEIVGITVLTGMALKRNNDCYKAECKLIDAECELSKAEADKLSKDIQIKALENEIKQLKGEVEEES